MNVKLLSSVKSESSIIPPKPQKPLQNPSNRPCLLLDLNSLNSSSAKSAKSKNLPSHRHSRSYGRTLPYPLPMLSPKQSHAGFTPSKALLESHDKLSQFEHSEIVHYKELFYLGCGRKAEKVLIDSDGFYKIVIGDHLAYRYEILDILGKGSFGTVVKCCDHKNNETVAVKIIRNNKRIFKYGTREVEVLDLLQSDSENENSCIVSKLESFEFRGHLCIVFELLATDLYEFLKQNHFQGITCNLSRRIATQVLIALKYSHSTGIIHCDIKPENIVFKSEHKSSIKVIDFGSTCVRNEQALTYIQSRFYRAPEIITQTGFNEKIDIWSLGCVVVEMACGWPLFPGENEGEMLVLMRSVLGNPPKELLKRSKNRKNEIANFCDENSGKSLQRCRIEEILEGFDPKMIDFVKKCLQWDHNKRISAEMGLVHPWIRGSRYQ